MYCVSVKSKTLSETQTARIEENKSGQMRGGWGVQGKGREGWPMEQQEERRCKILCIFNMSTGRQSILSEVLGMGGKTWTSREERASEGGEGVG